MSAPDSDGVCRCPWARSDALYIRYHDEEWGVPKTRDSEFFEKLILEGFQAGLSWLTILRKREGFRKAFDGFEPEKIVRYDEKKIAELDAQLAAANNKQAAPIESEIKLWQQRVGLMNALVEVHLTKASNVGL